MDRKLILLGAIFILAFISFISVVFLNEPIARLTRAANPSRQPSAQTSLIFAWPLTVEADGNTKSEISVFIRDAEGRGLENQEVRITASAGRLNSPSAVSDSTGKAVFNLTSDTPGVANIEAFVDNTKLLRKVSVQFK